MEPHSYLGLHAQYCPELVVSTQFHRRALAFSALSIMCLFLQVSALEVPPFRRLFRVPLHFCISRYWQWIYLRGGRGGPHLFNADLNPQVPHTRQWPWISDPSSSSDQVLELEACATLPGLHSPSNEHKTLGLLDEHSTNWATATAHHSCVSHEILRVAPTMAPGTDLTGAARKWRKKEKNAWTHRNTRFRWPGLSNRKKISVAQKLSVFNI